MTVVDTYLWINSLRKFEAKAWWGNIVAWRAWTCIYTHFYKPLHVNHNMKIRGFVPSKIDSTTVRTNKVRAKGLRIQDCIWWIFLNAMQKTWARSKKNKYITQSPVNFNLQSAWPVSDSIRAGHRWQLDWPVKFWNDNGAQSTHAVWVVLSR